MFVLIAFITMITISIIAIYFNVKSLKTILNQPIPKVSYNFDKNTLLNVLSKFNNVQNTAQKSKSINIKALAIAYSLDPAYSMALIYSDCGKKVMMAGDSFCGITLDKINPFYVIIKAQNTFKKVKLSKSGVSVANKNASLKGLPSLQQLLGQNNNTYIIPKSELLQITSNPSVMFSQINLVPTPKGFMFKGVNPNSLFAKMGIKPGDILVSINDEHLNSPEDAFRILETIRNADNFVVHIIRNNKSLTLNYQVR